MVSGRAVPSLSRDHFGREVKLLVSDDCSPCLRHRAAAGDFARPPPLWRTATSGQIALLRRNPSTLRTRGDAVLTGFAHALLAAQVRAVGFPEIASVTTCEVDNYSWRCFNFMLSAIRSRY